MTVTELIWKWLSLRASEADAKRTAQANLIESVIRAMDLFSQPPQVRRQAAVAAATEVSGGPSAPWAPPPEAMRTEIAPGIIEYARWWKTEVPPGGVVSIPLGAENPVEGTGWPNLPETRVTHFGVSEDFQPLRVTIAPGFELQALWIGAEHGFRTDGTVGVPSSALHAGLQPEFPICRKGITINVHIKNVASRPLYASARVTGARVDLDLPDRAAPADGDMPDLAAARNPRPTRRRRQRRQRRQRRWHR